MRQHERVIPVLLILLGGGLPAWPQESDSTRELRPELDTYINFGDRARLVLVQGVDQDRETPDKQNSLGLYFDYALRPLFRRELREREDVFRRRFLTFRGGYEYKASPASGDSSLENRAVLETTARYPLPGKIVVLSRNRGDLRFIRGSGFSARYRQRLRLERDLKLSRLLLTPYAYDEIFYDTRYGAWSSNRYVFGLEIPVGPHVVLEPYLLRQTNWRSSPRNLDAVGLTFNLYY